MTSHRHAPRAGPSRNDSDQELAPLNQAVLLECPTREVAQQFAILIDCATGYDPRPEKDSPCT